MTDWDSDVRGLELQDSVTAIFKNPQYPIIDDWQNYGKLYNCYPASMNDERTLYTLVTQQQ